MDHCAGVAVVVADIVVDHKVANHLLDIHHRGEVLSGRQLFQGLNQAALVSLGHAGFGILPDVGVALRVVVDILQLHISRAHAAPHARGRARLLPSGPQGGGGVKALGRVRNIKAAGGPFNGGHGRGLPAPRGRVPFRAAAGEVEAAHGKVLCHAPASPKAHAVRLVEPALVRAVIALQKGLLHPLHCQIQPPVLPVYGEKGEAAQGGLYPKGVHQGVGKIVLQHGGVLNQVVQAQLVQPIVGLAAVVVVELHLKAVALAAQSGHGGQRGVALCPNAHIFAGLPVNHHIGLIIFLVGGVGKQVFPVVHHNVDGVYPCVVKQTLLIAQAPGSGRKAQGLAVHQKNGERQGQGSDSPCGAVSMLFHRLPHVVPVVGDQHRAVDAGHFRELVDKVRVVLP